MTMLKVSLLLRRPHRYAGRDIRKDFSLKWRRSQRDVSKGMAVEEEKLRDGFKRMTVVKKLRDVLKRMMVLDGWVVLVLFCRTVDHCNVLFDYAAAISTAVVRKVIFLEGWVLVLLCRTVDLNV
jgi:hypothetical protein